ncbi:MAG: histone H1 [Bacteroidota bacterium]
MERYNKLKELVLSSEDDFEKFYAKQNKAAGTRARKAMQELKVLAQEIRQEIQEMKNQEPA